MQTNEKAPITTSDGLSDTTDDAVQTYKEAPKTTEKFRIPKRLRAWIRESQFLATTLSIILTFGTTGLVEYCQRVKDRKMSAIMVLSTIENFSTTVDLKAQKQFIQETMDKMTVQPKDPDRLAVFLSGGNQQKVILAKWLAKNPDVLILDEPTRGIDVNAKMEIYKIMNDLTTQGISLVMVSSEMNELMGMCDRILVMYEGELVAEFTRDENGEYSEDEIGRAQAGALS